MHYFMYKLLDLPHTPVATLRSTMEFVGWLEFNHDDC